jgi:hypothetical protein
MAAMDAEYRHAGGPGGEVACARCRPGESVARPRPGDVILIHGPGWLGRFIRLVQRIRHRKPDDLPFTYWSHAALVVTPAGHLVEVVATGVIISRLEKYRDRDYHYVHLDLPEPERRKAVQYAYSCVREKYGRFRCFLLGLAVLFGGRFQVRDRGQQGCGVLIARALQRAGMSFERAPADMMPADLAKRFGVMP